GTGRQARDVFPARLQVAGPDVGGWTARGQEVGDEVGWWHLDELDAAVAAGAVGYPRHLPQLARRLARGWDGTVEHLDESSSVTTPRPGRRQDRRSPTGRACRRCRRPAGAPRPTTPVPGAAPSTVPQGRPARS